MEDQKLSLDDAQILMTKAIKRIEKVLDEGNDNQAMNAGNCLSGLVSRYVKLVETAELEKRLEAIEKRMNQNSNLKKVK
jgi:hypothetical protein